jgi:hypothetical protein
MIFQIIVASFAMLFTPDFWRYSLWTLIPFIGFHLLLRWLLVHKTRIFAVCWFNISYPFIALITIIPIVFAILSFESITRLLIDKDTEPLLALHRTILIKNHDTYVSISCKHGILYSSQ